MLALEELTSVLIEHIKVSLCYAFLCAILHFLGSLIFPVVVNGYRKLPKATQFGWDNRAASIVHACVMFTATSYYWSILNPSMTREAEVSAHQTFLLDIMMGYMYYDAAVVLATTRDLEVLLHHVVGWISHISVRLTNSGPIAFYITMIYMAEGSTPLLHSLWMAHSLGKTSSKMFKALSVLLVLLFLVLRLVNGPYALYHMLVSKPDIPEWDDHPLLYWSNWAILGIFVLLNYFWFYVLVKVAVDPPEKLD